MTNGPEARVGDILEVRFARPRERRAVLEHPDYYRLREHLITFLEEHAHKKSGAGRQLPAANRPSAPLSPGSSHPDSEPKAAVLNPA